MEEYYLEDKHIGSGKGLILGVLTVFTVLLIALIYGFIKLGVWFINLISN
jgi:hypothetical protein